MTDLPPFLTDLDAIGETYRQRIQQEKRQLVASFDAATQQEPSLFAEQRKLSQLSQIPQDAVQARYDEVKRMIRAKQLQDAATLAANPVLAMNLRNRDFSAAVHDDLAAMQKAEGLFDWIGQQWDTGALTRRRGELGARYAMGWSNEADKRELAEIDRRLQAIPPRAGVIEKTFGGTLEILGQWLPSIPGALATGAAGAAAGSVATPVGAAAGFGYGFSAGMGAQAVITEGGSAYLDLMQSGYTQNEARSAALGVGLVNGALEAVGFRLASAPIKVALRQTVGKRFASELVKQTTGAAWGTLAKSYFASIGAEVVTEMLQETTNIAAEELLRAYTRPELASLLATADGRGQIADRVLGVAQKTFEGMLLLGLPGPVARLQSESRRAEVVDTQTKILEALQKGAAVEPKLLERAPDLFHQFVADAAGNSVPDLTVDAAALLQTLRQADSAQAEAGRIGTERSVTDSLRAKMPGVLDDLEQKAARGEDVTIPTADFVTHVAKTPLGADLLQHLRVDPDALSQSERDRSAPLLKELTDEAKAIVKDAKDTSKQILESAKKVMQRQLDELKATNKFQGVEARANARLYTSFVTVNAAKLNMTPEEFDAKFRLETVAAGATLNQQTAVPSYGTPVDGAETVRGVHFTREPRTALSGEFYGSGLRGAEARRVTGDPTLSKRVHFYVDTGAGIQPEPGVGDVRTETTLTNVYNTDKDPRGLVQAWRDSGSRDFNELEQAIVNAGFDGIFVPRAQRVGEGTQGVVTLLGPRHTNVPVSVTQDNRRFRQTVTVRSGRESMKRYGLKPGVRYTVRQVAAALETRQRAKWGVIDPKDRSAESAQKIAKWMAEEVEFEAGNPDSGLGWYSVKFQQALDTAGTLFPELKTDQTARGVLTALVAVTSDGQEPIGNFKQALDIYSRFRDSRKLTVERSTARQASVAANLQVLQRLFDSMGEGPAISYLLSEDTVGALKKLAAEAGGEFTSAFTVDTKVPMAALELGPKLGSFFANLMGRAGYLTMDRWWSRTFNRYRGTLVAQPTEVGLRAFKEAMGHPEWTDEEAAAATVPLRKSYEAKDFKNGTALEKQANTIFKLAFLELEDTPFNATDRTFMLDAATRAQKLLKRRGLDLTIADIQAALWYYEKRLYGELGAKDSGKVAFDVAARRAVEELNGQRTGVSDGGVEGSVPADAAGQVDDPIFDGGLNGQSTAAGDQAGAGGLRDAGGVRGSDGVVADQGRQDLGPDQPLAGLPAVVKVDGREVTFGPFQPARDAARRYAERAGIAHNPPTTYVKVDPERAKRIADAFEAMPHDPQNPDVKAAYDAMIAETLAQWEAIKETGLVVEFITGADPYGNPRNTILDVVQNNHLWVFPTDAGFGGTESANVDITGNPLLQVVEGETISGRPVRANDIFRIVHDYFGHIMEGVGFRAEGEENAWQQHMAMFSPLARKALTTETRGQNSWVNFGPFAQANRTANGADTQYAPQKIGVLPDWVMTEGYAGGRSTFAQMQTEGGIGFYSALLRGVRGLTAKTLSPDGWKQQLTGLKNKGVVKPDELEWSGVLDWLDLQEGKVTREQLEEFLSERGVRVETVVKEEQNNVDGEEARYAPWQARRGGDFYRELLLVLPPSIPPIPDHPIAGGYASGAELRARAEEVIAIMGWSSQAVEDAAVLIDENVASAASRGAPLDPDEVLPSTRDLAAALMDGTERAKDRFDVVHTLSVNYGQARRDAVAIAKKSTYKSSHWAERNVLAHTRVSAFDAGRTLFVHEIQSDWGQEGRDRGFFDEKKQARLEEAAGTTRDMARQVAFELQQRIDELQAPEGEAQVEARQQILDADPEVQQLRKELQERNDAASSAQQELRAYSKTFSDNSPPSGPFVQSTEGWLNLALKRLFIHGVESLVERIEFATGNEVADMFDPERFITWIESVTPTKQDFTGATHVFRVELQGQRGWIRLAVENGVIQEVDDDSLGDIENKPLAEVFGAETAEAMLAMPVDGEAIPGSRLPYGSGHRAFYDKIVPLAVEKLAKKLGGEVSRVDGRLSVAITPKMREAVFAGLPLFQGARGEFDPAKLRIILGQSADSSTWLHELGHYFLTVYAQMAALPEAPAAVQQDMQTLLDWFGVPNLEAWAGMSLDQQRKHHEAFAYNFERYLFEGKAPTAAQQRLFDRFMEWLRIAYKAMLAEVLGVQLDAAYRADVGEALPQLSPEVRSVMNRMIAAEEEIRAATVRDAAVPLFQTREEFVKQGGNEDDWKELSELAAAADAAAVSQLTQDSLRQMTWLRNARGKVLRKLQAEKDGIREKLREEEAPRVARMKVYRAIAWLQDGVVRNEAGEVIGEPSPVHKLNRALTKAIEPELSLGLVRRFTAENGVAPDEVAMLFGFDSGDSMVKALMETPPITEAIESSVQSRLLAEYAELSNPKEIERAIDKALHNDARTRFVAAELRHLLRAEKPVQQLVAAAKEAARVGLQGRKVREVSPRVFVRGERRASQRAFEALRKGDTEGAIVAKRQQLLQEQLALHAIEASEEIDTALRSFEPVWKPDEKVGKTREIALVSAARALLAAFQIGGSAEQRTAMLTRASELLEQIKAYDPAMFTEVNQLIGLSLAGAKDYRDLTLAEFRVLRDTVQSLWWQSKRRKQVEIEGQLMARDEALDAMRGEIAPRVPSGPLPGENEAPSLRQRVVRRLQGMRSAARRAESLFDSLGASFTRFLFRPVQGALDAYRKDRNALVAAFVDKLSALGKLPVGKIAAPEIGYTFGAGNGGLGIAELLGAMLHTGNDSNFAKLLVGRGWTDPNEPFIGEERETVNSAQWDKLLERLEKEGVVTEAHWKWVRSVWELMEQTKPIAQRAHKKLFGHYFKEVKARTVKTSFGDFAGGYVPAKTDEFLVRDARINAGMEALESDFRQSLPAVGMGFVKARVEEYRRPLSLDIRKIASHIDGLVRFAHVQPAIRDVLSMMRDPALAAQMNAVDPVMVEGTILPWLTRAARQVTEQPGMDPTIDQFWRTVRTRTGMSTMFLNLSNAMQQVTGWFPAALKVKPTYLQGALNRYLRAPRQVAAEIGELSSHMKNRFDNQLFELTDAINDVLLNPNKFQKLQKWTGRHTYVLQSTMQNMVDAVTWVGAHEQALADGASDVDAIAKADAAVRLTQGSNDAEALSRFEAGSPFVRTLTQFSGYFNMLANLNLTEFQKVVQSLGWRGGASSLFYVFVLGFAAPMLVSDAIARTASGQWDDEDDDGYADELASWTFGGLGRGALALLPFGTAVMPLVNAWNDKPYDDRMMTSPAVSALEAATVGVIRTVRTAIDPERDVTGKGIRDVLTLLTLLTGLPFAAAGRPIGYAMDVAGGRVEPYNAADLTRGLVTGRPAEGTRQP